MSNNYHYYQKEQSDLHSNPNTFDFNFKGLNLKYTTDDGVFSKKYIDYGSFVMLNNFEPNNLEYPILDMGAGYGALGITISKLFNKEVHMCEINSRAYDLIKHNMDGVHIQGPARFGKIHNIFGNANDDHVALCANGTIRSEITRGDIEDVDIDGVYCDNGYTGVRLLSRGDAIRNISINNIHGEFRYYAISFTHHYPLRDDMPVLLENVRISNVFASKSSATNIKEEHKYHLNHGALIWFENGVNCYNVNIENVYRNERNLTTNAPTIRISETANVNNLTIRNLNNDFKGRDLVSIENLSNSKYELN